MGTVPTGTVTFLFSDVEGSTRLWESHAEGMSSALARYDDIMRKVVDGAGGYVFSTAGDSYSAAFTTPARAVEAAIQAQSQLVDLDREPVSFRVRMAVHTGTAEERDGDYFGPALNRTARLMSIGNGRQVLVSRATAELARDSLPEGARLEDLGQHRLKDLSRPEYVYKLGHPSLPDDPRRLRSLDMYPHNLPIQLTSFVGREEEVEEVMKLLRGSRLVTLAGVGGVGKTRLAVQAAAEVLSQYEDGVWLVELAPLTDRSKLATTVMDVLGIEEKTGEDPIDTAVRWLTDKEILLILDNCEHVVDEAARFAARALASGTGLSILATSREMLGVPGEYPFQVRSLAAPESMDDVVQSALMRYPAIRLFAERGELARAGWRITSENGMAVVQICNRLDGMPLAIELAAARLRMMRTSQIAERLDNRFRLLTGGSRTVLPRQQTLEAAIDWSFDLLSEEEKVLFRRLAVFMGGFTLEAVEAVCGADPLDDLMVLDLLGHLVEKSLVQAEELPDGVRYQMLETLRQYSRDKLAKSEEIDQMRRRHAEFFLGLGDQAEPNLRGKEEDYWIKVLDDELDNLRQAMNWALEAPAPEIAQALAGDMYRYFMFRFRTIEGREWAERALQASEEPTVARAKALLAAGTLAQVGLDLEGALTRLDDAVEMSRGLQANEILMPALNNRAGVASALGRWDEAERFFQEDLELSRDLGARDSIIFCLVNLSGLALDREDYSRAIALAEEAVEVAVDLGSARLIDQAYMDLAFSYRDSGDFEAAATALDVVIGQEEELGFRFYPGRTRVMAGILAMDRGDFDGAVPLFRGALRAFRDLPDALDLVWVVQWLVVEGARLLTHLERPAEGAGLLGAADESLAEKGYIRGAGEAREADRIRHDVEQAMGAEEFQTAYQKGRSVGLRDALDRLIATLDDL